MTVTPPRRWYQFSLRTALVLVTILCIGPGGYVAHEQQKLRREDAAVVLLNKLVGTEVYSRPHWLWSLMEGNSAGNVVGLGFRSPQVTDAGLSPLTALPELVWLTLSDTPITDAGLAHLAELKKLKRLRLDETSVSDAGLAQLTKLTTLETLNLSRTKITDAGLSHLAGLANLETLDLQKTKVTRAGVAELQKSLPNCAINR